MLAACGLIHITLCEWEGGREGGINMLKILGATVQNFSRQSERDPDFGYIWIRQFTTIYKYVSIFGKMFAVTVVTATFAP
jgi:hypothetical protein